MFIDRKSGLPILTNSSIFVAIDFSRTILYLKNIGVFFEANAMKLAVVGILGLQGEVGVGVGQRGRLLVEGAVS